MPHSHRRDDTLAAMASLGEKPSPFATHGAHKYSALDCLR